MLERSGRDVRHGWVVGDDEFGRATEFRDLLRARAERYVLDVPCNTNVRDLDGVRPAKQPSRGGRRSEVPFVRVDAWAVALPAGRWTRLMIRDGSRGPMVVEAATTRVVTRRDRRVGGPEERLLVIRTTGPEPELTYALSSAPAEVPPAELVRARSQRHRVEQVFQEAKGEVGLAHYEVRSWVGWYHHVTPSLLALWFLILEKRRIGGEDPGGGGVPVEGDLHEAARPEAADIGGDRRGGQLGAAA